MGLKTINTKSIPSGINLIPEMFFVKYKSKSDTYIEVADIIDGNIGAVRPISDDVINDLAKLALLEAEKKKNKKAITTNISCVVPSNLLYFDFNNGINLTWFVPGEKKKLLFTTKGLTGIYNLPDMVFELKDSSFHVFPVEPGFLKAKKKKLYKNPFPNSFGDNSICQGNCKMDKNGNINYIIKEYTDFFFKSKFSAPFNEEYVHYWKIAKEEPFPKEYFIKQNLAYENAF